MGALKPGGFPATEKEWVFFISCEVIRQVSD
jgi:hypothetical protein